MSPLIHVDTCSVMIENIRGVYMATTCQTRVIFTNNIDIFSMKMYDLAATRNSRTAILILVQCTIPVSVAAVVLVHDLVGHTPKQSCRAL